jgi:predicted nucleic acid-binding protein
VADFFLDTNIFLYAISTEPAEAAKTSIARRLLQHSGWAWSAQVAAEFARTSTSKKQTRPLTWHEAGQWIQVWTAFPMAHSDGALVLSALQIAERFMISYYDAQIVAAARRLQLPVVYTEDLNHGQDYGGTLAINPFKPDVVLPV